MTLNQGRLVHYSQSTLLTDFTPSSPWRKSGLKLVCNRHCIRKPQVWELSRLCHETSTKLYVHKFGFWILPCYLRLECEFTTTAVFQKNTADLNFSIQPTLSGRLRFLNCLFKEDNKRPYFYIFSVVLSPCTENFAHYHAQHGGGGVHRGSWHYRGRAGPKQRPV